MSSFFQVIFERYFRKYDYSKTTKDRERGLHEVLEAAGRQKCCRNWPLLLLIPAALYFYTQATGPHLHYPKLVITPRKWLTRTINTQLGKTLSESETVEDPDGATVRKHTYQYKLIKHTTSTLPFGTSTAATAATVTDVQHYCSSTVARKTEPRHVLFKLQLTNIPDTLEDIYPLVQKGGYYKPKNCIAKHKVAVLVPYRKRSQHLLTFLYNIHPFLMAQQIEYQIFLIEQFGDIDFNKGRLFNAGYLELLKPGQKPWSCVVLHNVDLLPASLNVSYACPSHPKHLSCNIVGDSNKTSSSTSKCDGACILPIDQFERVNGYSNMYWDLGGEDADFKKRLNSAGLPIIPCNKESEQFISLSHDNATIRPGKLSRQLLYSAKDRSHCEGLRSTQYQLVSVERTRLYTRLLINIDQYGEMKELHYKDITAPRS